MTKAVACIPSKARIYRPLDKAVLCKFCRSSAMKSQSDHWRHKGRMVYDRKRKVIKAIIRSRALTFAERNATMYIDTSLLYSYWVLILGYFLSRIVLLTLSVLWSIKYIFG